MSNFNWSFSVLSYFNSPYIATGSIGLFPNLLFQGINPSVIPISITPASYTSFNSPTQIGLVLDRASVVVGSLQNINTLGGNNPALSSLSGLLGDFAQ